MRPIKYLIWLRVIIPLLLSSCTYDYIYLEGFKVTTLNVSCTQSFCDNIIDVFRIQNVDEGIVEITFTGRDDSGQITDEEVYLEYIYLDLSDWMEGYFGSQILKPGDIGSYEFPEGTSNVKVSINLYRRFNNGLNEEVINSYELPEEFAMVPLKTTEIVLDGSIDGTIQASLGESKIFTVQISDKFSQKIIDVANNCNISNYSTDLYVREYDNNKQLLSTSKVTDKYTKVSAATQFISLYSELIDDNCVTFARINDGRFFDLLIGEITNILLDDVEIIVDDLSEKKYSIEDNGFHEMTLRILKEYGASIVYHQRGKTIEQYDKEGNLLKGGKYNLAEDCYVSAPGAAYIVVKVAMNAGKMGYICTDPIELKLGGINEIILDKNTPVHVELNMSEESLPTRYIISQAENFDKVLLPIAQANGYDSNTSSINQSSIYVHIFNEKGDEIDVVNVKKSMLGELQTTSDNATSFIIRIALYKPKGSYLVAEEAVEVDEVYHLTPHKLTKVILDNNTKIKLYKN